MNPRRRITDNVSHRRRRSMLTVASILASAVLATCLTVAMFAVIDIGTASSQSCTAALDVRDAMSDVLLDAKRRTEHAPARTPREQEQAAEFYANSLRRLQQVSCTKSP